MVPFIFQTNGIECTLSWNSVTKSGLFESAIRNRTYAKATLFIKSQGQNYTYQGTYDCHVDDGEIAKDLSSTLQVSANWCMYMKNTFTAEVTFPKQNMGQEYISQEYI